SPTPQEVKSVVPRAGAAVPEGLAATWVGLPPALKLGAIAAGALLIIAVAYKAVQTKQAQRGLDCPDTVAVDDDTPGFSFGHGEVDVECGAKVVFGFNAPPNTRVLFHYQPMHIGSPSELELRANGKHLSWAPVAGARGEPQVVTLPQDSLAADGRNFITLTESARKDWAIGKVRVETLAITPGDLAAARAAYDRGRRKLEERRIAPRNLYDAWKAFTEA